MESTKDTKLGGLQSTFSRRNLLKGAVALAAAASVPEAFGQQPTGAPRGTVWLYIGTYTGNPGGGGNGEGIYLCELNLSTGKLTVLRLVAPVVPAMGTTPSTASPSTIALDPTRTHLYAGNEYGPPGAVSAYSINRLTGDLTLLNVQPAVGAPAHVSVDHTASIFSRPNTQAATSKCSQFWRMGRSGLRCFSSKISITLGRRRPPTRLRGVSRSALMRGRMDTRTRWRRTPRTNGFWAPMRGKTASTSGN